MGNSLGKEFDSFEEEVTFTALFNVFTSDSFANVLVNEYESTKKKKKHRENIGKCKNMWDSQWGKLMRNPDVQCPNTRIGKLFRRRFRIEFKVFVNEVLPLCEENNVFEMRSTSAIPTEFKILVALRVRQALRLYV